MLDSYTFQIGSFDNASYCDSCCIWNRCDHKFYHQNQEEFVIVKLSSSIMSCGAECAKEIINSCHEVNTLVQRCY